MCNHITTSLALLNARLHRDLISLQMQSLHLQLFLSVHRLLHVFKSMSGNNKWMPQSIFNCRYKWKQTVVLSQFYHFRWGTRILLNCRYREGGKRPDLFSFLVKQLGFPNFCTKKGLYKPSYSSYLDCREIKDSLSIADLFGNPFFNQKTCSLETWRNKWNACSLDS